MSTVVKEHSELKETIFRLIKGKQSLDQILSIPVNFQKEGLGYTLNKKNAPKTKNPIPFVKATSDPSTSRSPPKSAPKPIPRTTTKPPPKFQRQSFPRESANSNWSYLQPLNLHQNQHPNLSQGPQLSHP